MEDNNLFALVWKLAALVLCVLIVTGGACTSYETHRITGHADPIAAKCALSPYSNAQACMVVGSRGR